MARVLIVDDDPVMQELLRQKLEEAGLEGDSVGGGREALEALCRATAADEPYSAMVLDLIMPFVSGWQVLEAIRGNPLWSDMPVVVISGYANGTGDLARVSDYGCFFVEKQGNFLDMVCAALGRLVHAA
ncbi:MAG: response regulator [Armatimonadota bacterium]